MFNSAMHRVFRKEYTDLILAVKIENNLFIIIAIMYISHYLYIFQYVLHPRGVFYFLDSKKRKTTFNRTK